MWNAMWNTKLCIFVDNKKADTAAESTLSLFLTSVREVSVMTFLSWLCLSCYTVF